MTKPARRLTVEWQQPRWWSNYQRGVVEAMHGFDALTGIWRHTPTAEICIYTPDHLDNQRVLVNGETVVMRARGRFGDLYISE